VATSLSKSNELDINSLEAWLWKAACSIRGPVDAPKFKDYILPLVFLRRLSDVFDDEVERLSKEFGSKEKALKIIESDKSLVRFFIPEKSRWEIIKKLSQNTGEEVTTAFRRIAKINVSLRGVIDIIDYNASVSGQRIIEDGRLESLITILSDPKYRMGLEDVEPDVLGRSYEYLLRKFAEGGGQTAGEFFTPKEVGWLIARLIDPKQGQTVYDPTCGSTGLLIKCQLTLKKKNKKIEKPLQLFGQELNHVTHAIAKMNMIIHDIEGSVELGDTFKNPKFKEKSVLDTFDFVVANPMWNQPEYDKKFYEEDVFSRFEYGIPPTNTADWGWLQHILKSLNSKGRAAIVLDTGAMNRGTGNEGKHREKDIRKEFVENDFVECMILLPENLFYNATGPGIIIILNKSKEEKRKDKVIMINASRIFKKGKPKNFIPMDQISDIVNPFRNFDDGDDFVKIITKNEIIKNNYVLSPTWYIKTDPIESFRKTSEIINELSEIKKIDNTFQTKIGSIMKKLGTI